MKIEEFIVSMNKLAPTAKDIVNNSNGLVDIDKEFAEDLREDYLISFNSDFSASNDKLYDLIYQSNISSKTIGHLYFDNKITQYDDRLRVFGRYHDVYYLAEDIVTNEIKSVNRESQNVESTCAFNINLFLEAIIIYQRIFVTCMVRKEKVDFSEITTLKKTIGEEGFIHFFKVLLETFIELPPDVSSL
ncbi:hypothetical protein [Marinifilum sp. D714]|uniref:hypothetical protein n=1 Tax=Marinifilum sp. D714 TaxID=2937523 RepID=UPI0027C79A34|nr:hypothetical protein [Marinifilum sp. D714]MDQ2180549.1 hypothetical protein [Marinifilum sp. D714]